MHEAGHAVVGCLLAEEAGRTPVEVRVFREVSPESAAGHTVYRRCIGIVRTRSGYLAEVTGLLAGLAAEEIVLGTRGDGSGGSDGSDLQRATALATALEASLGLGDGLAYLSPNDDAELLRRLRADPSLRSAVERTLSECLGRARAMLGARRSALGNLSDHLVVRARASLEEIVGCVTGGDGANVGYPRAQEDSQGMTGIAQGILAQPAHSTTPPDKRTLPWQDADSIWTGPSRVD
ncbi:hypothetical protein [Microvirga sp. KLBC 81]|uniref:hypothetical protein n=1 Tax=Microvirga sp. KLBC 81 TaxID=1862707 RepID=UPI001FDEFD16|nr:hypothetical protein [Microvirga sp. KLBC 81]